MKKLMISAACVLFAATGFSQTVDTKTETGENSKSCAKGKAACCAHAAKSCDDKKETAKASDNSEVAPDAKATINANEPKRSTKATSDNVSSGL